MIISQSYPLIRGLFGLKITQPSCNQCKSTWSNEFYLANDMDNLWREVYFTCYGEIKVPDFYNIKFSINMSYFFWLDMFIKPSFKVKNIALINIKYNEK